MSLDNACKMIACLDLLYVQKRLGHEFDYSQKESSGVFYSIVAMNVPDILWTASDFRPYERNSDVKKQVLQLILGCEKMESLYDENGVLSLALALWQKNIKRLFASMQMWLQRPMETFPKKKSVSCKS